MLRNYSIDISNISVLPDIKDFEKKFGDMLTYVNHPIVLAKNKNVREYMLDYEKKNGDCNLQIHFDQQDLILAKTVENFKFEIKENKLYLNIKYECPFGEKIDKREIMDRVWRHGVGKIFMAYIHLYTTLINNGANENEVANMCDFNRHVEENLKIKIKKVK
jgi:hypothetical protein